MSAELAALEKCKASLDAEMPLRRLELSEDEETLLRGFRFLTGKPLIAVVNLDEDEIRDEAGALAPFAGWASGPGDGGRGTLRPSRKRDPAAP